MSGSDDDGDVYRSVDAEPGSSEVDGDIYDENGTEHHISGEWSGKGEIDADDDDGNHYDLETQ